MKALQLVMSDKMTDLVKLSSLIWKV